MSTTTTQIRMYIISVLACLTREEKIRELCELREDVAEMVDAADKGEL